MSREDDRSLRFFNEVLGLEHLHYGLWNGDEPVNLENLKEAQRRYESHLVSKIPAGVRTILDVGCGTAALSARLKGSGYEVEGLSPDRRQKDLYLRKVQSPFHAARFENFTPEKRYQCVIMSESSQYIPLERLFENASRCLEPGGHLLVFDYFVRNHADGIFRKNGHNLDAFLAEAKQRGFELVESDDVTERVIKTLELAKSLSDKSVIAIDIATDRFRTRHRYCTRLVLWWFRKKIAKLQKQRLLLEPDKFRENKCYVLLVFRKTAESGALAGPSSKTGS